MRVAWQYIVVATICALSRHLGILYDTEAINYNLTTLDKTAVQSTDDAFSGNGLLFHPLEYDAEVGPIIPKSSNVPN